ncbi:MAG: hypothetical protein Q8R28_15325 [Dehalococcoidia bacterium]|nr:hypothetical protein [Dehalococcoidia bacterium]
METVPRLLARVIGISETKPDACVSYSRLLAGALKKLGYQAEVVGAQYIIGTSSYHVVLGSNIHGQADHEYFHAAVWLPARKELIDLTITQASRPEHGWVAKPLWSKIEKLPEYIRAVQLFHDGDKLPSFLYSKVLTNPEVLEEALALVIDGEAIEISTSAVPL